MDQLEERLPLPDLELTRKDVPVCLEAHQGLGLAFSAPRQAHGLTPFPCPSTATPLISTPCLLRTLKPGRVKQLVSCYQ